jgi:hypothetical protein
MSRFLKSFRKDEAGDATVDWIVLTAAVVALSGTTYSAIESGATSLGTATLAHLTEKAPAANLGASRPTGIIASRPVPRQRLRRQMRSVPRHGRPSAALFRRVGTR